MHNDKNIWRLVKENIDIYFGVTNEKHRIKCGRTFWVTRHKQWIEDMKKLICFNLRKNFLMSYSEKAAFKGGTNII
jgi:predicted RNA-binding protein YlxR (DUF448 family)